MELNLVQLFSKADDAERFSAGEVIFREGDPSDRMFILLDGAVEIVIGDEVVDTLAAGDSLGEMALVDNNPRSATGIAKSSCRLAPVDDKRFMFMVQNTPYFALHMLKMLTKRLRAMDERV